MSTLAEIRALYVNVQATNDDRVKVAKQDTNIWRFLWRDDSGDWGSASTWYRTRRLLMDAYPQFIAHTYGETVVAPMTMEVLTNTLDILVATLNASDNIPTDLDVSVWYSTNDGTWKWSALTPAPNA